MDKNQISNLMEAYVEIYAPQKEIEEAVKGESSERRKALAAERKAGVKPLSPSKGRQNADKMERDIKYFDKVTKKTKPSVVGMTHENMDKFDATLAELMEHGHTKEEALKIMANPTI